MTKEQVIELAKQAGIPTYKGMNGAEYLHVEGVEVTDEIEALIKLVRNAALEEAANTCGGLNNDEATSAHRYDKGTTERRAWNQATTDCAAAIESLKEPTP